MAKQQYDSASEDVQPTRPTHSISFSSISFGDVDSVQVQADRRDSVVSGAYQYANHYSCTLPYHLFSACGNDGRMCQYSKTITSRDLSRGVRRIAAKGTSVFHRCIAHASYDDIGSFGDAHLLRAVWQATHDSVVRVFRLRGLVKV
jgi:hypothetical protein